MRQADLNELATMNRIPPAVVLREAVDDLLEKHRVIWSRSRDHGALLRDISGDPLSASYAANSLRHDHVSAREGPL